PDQAVGRAILGTSERVYAFTPENLIDFRNMYYGGEQMVVAAAGRIDHHELVERVAQSFDTISPGKKEPRQPARFSGGISVLEKPLDQTHILLSFPTIGYLHKDIYATQVLSIVLGGGMSSKLFQQVREERGLCYAVYAHVSAFEDSGLFSVYAGTAPDKSEELIAVMAQTISSMTSAVSQAELDRAKNQIKAGLVMSLESSSARADQLARQFLAFGEVPGITQIIALIDAVTLADIRRLALQIFACEKPSFAAVGSLAKLPEYDKIRARFQQ
ncbi:MAG TPA: insulinase family protein, partial [Rhizobiales bacterium]|nr:insulinase family protein [Hyphomicrobiales bacterium]